MFQKMFQIGKLCTYRKTHVGSGKIESEGEKIECKKLKDKRDKIAIFSDV
jgi:hypothetical protein